ncbi:glycerophosphodiester phosphodiesterase family protein [Pseudopelagicola sp. nBUS_20]|uniref:glycerophosphodiester phosphodiesterase family protein n=1 Tax=Pseudopelagicola sp. nBUS_20 TaxID=3395317 RepID=UPI003EBD26FD
MAASKAFKQRWRSRRRDAMISVHRGLWGPAPENSLAAISGAREYDIIEIDTQIASDGVPVVIHDPDLMRTTGKFISPRDTGHGAIVSQRLLEASGGPGAAITSERIPTLADALSAAGPSAFFDIDVKFPDEIDAVAAMLAKSNLAHMGSLKIDTQTASDIERLLLLQRRFGVMIMAKVVLPKAGLGHISELVNAGVAAVELWFDDLEQLGEACQIAGVDMAVSTYTLDPVHCCGLNDTLALSNPDAVWGRLLNAGITVIMTDQPARLDAYMAARDKFS